VTISTWATWQAVADATGGDIKQPIATRHPELIVDFVATHFEILPVGCPTVGLPESLTTV